MLELRNDNNYIDTINLADDFRLKATKWSGIIIGFLILPFAIKNIIHVSPLYGLAIMILSGLCWAISWHAIRGRTNDWFLLLVGVPFSIIILIKSISYLGISGLLWSFPAVVTYYLVLPEKKAWAANGIHLLSIIPAIWINIPFEVAIRATVVYLYISISIIIFVRIIEAQRNILVRLAILDNLTGLYNRNTLDYSLAQSIEEHKRLKVPMSLLAIDLDYFKKINDELGHDAGDDVLREVGAMLADKIRKVDKAYRVGGEEFMILLMGTDTNGAYILAEKIRNDISGHSFFPDRIVSVSIGVANLKENENADDWKKRADENLYSAKATGRNRTISDVTIQ